ncbi:hypothetical protein RQP46_002389 [Phenoliferia psychrophenolica]
MPLPRNRQPKPKRAPNPRPSDPATPTPEERVDELQEITGPEDRSPRANGSPFRPYDLAPEDVMLNRLLSPPGFGRAWDALPTDATPRQMFFAHFEDVALIFDPFQLASIREEARKGHQKYGPCCPFPSAKGEGFSKLFAEFIIPKNKLVKEKDLDDTFYPIPNKEFETAFGIGEERLVPRARALRCFQGAMRSQRHSIITTVIQAIVNYLSGAPIESRPQTDTGFLLNSENIDGQYKSYVEELALRHLDDPNPPKPASREAWRKHMTAYATVHQGIDATPTCVRCHKSVNTINLAESPAAKFMRCNGCKKVAVKTLYCSVVCQTDDWRAHKRTCGVRLADQPTREVPIL